MTVAHQSPCVAMHGCSGTHLLCILRLRLLIPPARIGNLRAIDDAIHIRGQYVVWRRNRYRLFLVLGVPRDRGVPLHPFRVISKGVD